jgi:hypothetical protein
MPSRGFAVATQRKRLPVLVDQRTEGHRVDETGRNWSGAVNAWVAEKGGR